MPNRDVSDEQLMARVAAGDERALEALYDRHAAAAMGLALRIMGDRASAEDVVQETFLRVWRHAASFRREQGRFTSWMFSIAHRLAIDGLRRRSVRPQPAQSAAEEQAMARQASDEAAVPEAAWASMRQQQVRQALASLPKEQLQVIELAYFQGLTRQEIAAATQSPVGTVHTRARLALEKLRGALRSSEDDV
jgi:RNA polymerase sigma-70 factor (ECF subfamily)